MDSIIIWIFQTLSLFLRGVLIKKDNIQYIYCHNLSSWCLIRVFLLLFSVSSNFNIKIQNSGDIQRFIHQNYPCYKIALNNILQLFLHLYIALFTTHDPIKRRHTETNIIFLSSNIFLKGERGRSIVVFFWHTGRGHST